MNSDIKQSDIPTKNSSEKQAVKFACILLLKHLPFVLVMQAPSDNNNRLIIKTSLGSWRGFCFVN